MSKLLILIHLRSLQSVTSSNNQTIKVVNVSGIFNIVVKSVNF